MLHPAVRLSCIGKEGCKGRKTRRSACLPTGRQVAGVSSLEYGQTDINQMNGGMGKVLDYQKLETVLQQAMAEGKTTVNLGGVEVSVADLRMASQINDRISMSGQSMFTGAYKSDTDKALLSDGYMSMEEALVAQKAEIARYKDSFFGLGFAATPTEAYSVQYVLGEHDKVDAYFSDEATRESWTNDADKYTVNAGGEVMKEWDGITYTLYNSKKDIYHVDPNDVNTFKWCADSDIRSEFVLGKDKDGNTYVQNRPELMGTHNAGWDNTSHFYMDVMGTYWLHGNSPTDTTGLFEKIWPVTKKTARFFHR